MDAALITAAQRVEEAKIAAYGTACALAEQLAEPEHISLLHQTLDEEKRTDAKLAELSIEINTAAAETICAACLRTMAQAGRPA
jgi:ferritin-like metal-binding protein YciE